jgi:hypothetical protein
MELLYSNYHYQNVNEIWRAVCWTELTAKLYCYFLTKVFQVFHKFLAEVTSTAMSFPGKMWLGKVLLFLAALPLLGILACGGKCPPGFELVGCKCYHFSTVRRSFHNAMKACQGLGAKLAEPLDAKETHLLRRRYASYADRKNTNIWLGIHDMNHEKRYEYYIRGHSESLMNTA